LLAEEVVKVPAFVWKQTFGALLGYDGMGTLPLVEAPTLLVWGDADALITRQGQDVCAPFPTQSSSCIAALGTRRVGMIRRASPTTS
jgi:hypothetical protein